jgi:hypothetical protein
MGRLLLHGFYLWRHVLSTVPPFILWWWQFAIPFDPLPRSSSFLGGQRWQPIQTGHSLHIKGKGGGRSRYYSILMSMFLTSKTFVLFFLPIQTFLIKSQFLLQILYEYL